MGFSQSTSEHSMVQFLSMILLPLLDSQIFSGGLSSSFSVELLRHSNTDRSLTESLPLEEQKKKQPSTGLDLTLLMKQAVRKSNLRSLRTDVLLCLELPVWSQHISFLEPSQSDLDSKP